MNVEDFDEEQDLQGLKTNIFNKLSSSSAQTIAIPTQPEQSEPRLEQPEQSIVEQTTEQTARPEQQTIEQTAEQTIKPTSPE